MGCSSLTSRSEARYNYTSVVKVFYQRNSLKGHDFAFDVLSQDKVPSRGIDYRPVHIYYFCLLQNNNICYFYA